MMGSLVKGLAGSKNQNMPTPKVKATGKTKDKRVIFFPRPSLRLQTKRPRVRSDSPAIAKNLVPPSRNCMPIKPKERRAEVTKNLCLLDICLGNYVIGDVHVGIDFLNVCLLLEAIQERKHA
jgi:hypothetical protein